MSSSWVGVFGKHPQAGDFVARGLPAGLRRPLDLWVTRNLARRDTGWPEGGLRGVLDLSGTPVLLLALPSRDRTGRRFPLIAATNPPGTISEAMSWCDDALPAMTAAVAGDADLDTLQSSLPPASDTRSTVAEPGFWQSDGSLTPGLDELFEKARGASSD